MIFPVPEASYSHEMEKLFGCHRKQEQKCRQYGVHAKARVGRLYISTTTEWTSGIAIQR
jgi:hypothetical protein